jgi:class 3 adenylate cyclase
MAELPAGTVTLLFADIEGSTRLVQQVEHEYRAVLSACRRLLRAEVAAAGGTEVDCRADEHFAVFRTASDAAAAAIGAHRALAAHTWPEGVAVRVRIGLHTGAPEVEADSYLGLDVNRAARICSAGHGGQTLLSQTTRDLIADDLQVEDLGSYALHGVAEPERLFQLTVSGLPARFPPLRATASRTRWAVRARALRWSRQRAPSLEETAWSVRSHIPAADLELRQPLGELGAALFAGHRAVVGADGFLARVDRKRLEQRLADARYVADISRSAREEANACEARLAAADHIQYRRGALAAFPAEIEDRLPTLRTTTEIDALRERVAASTTELDDAVGRAAETLDPLSFKLRRTRRRGIYRSGRLYAVRYFDDLGAERQREFTTLKEARDFRWTLRIRDQAKAEYSGPPMASRDDAYSQGGGGH